MRTHGGIWLDLWMADTPGGGPGGGALDSSGAGVNEGGLGGGEGGSPGVEGGIASQAGGVPAAGGPGAPADVSSGEPGGGAPTVGPQQAVEGNPAADFSQPFTGSTGAVGTLTAGDIARGYNSPQAAYDAALRQDINTSLGYTNLGGGTLPFTGLITLARTILSAAVSPLAAVAALFGLSRAFAGYPGGPAFNPAVSTTGGEAGGAAATAGTGSVFSTATPGGILLGLVAPSAPTPLSQAPVAGAGGGGGGGSTLPQYPISAATSAGPNIALIVFVLLVVGIGGYIIWKSQHKTARAAA